MKRRKTIWLITSVIFLFQILTVTALEHLQPEPMTRGKEWHLEAESASTDPGGWTHQSISDANTVRCVPANDNSKWLQWEDLDLPDDEYNIYLSWAHNAPSTWITGKIYAGPDTDNLRIVDNYQAVTFNDESTLQWNLISRALPLLATDKTIRVTFNTAQLVYRQYVDDLLITPYLVPAHIVRSNVPLTDPARSPLSPKGQPGKKLSLASSGKADYVILLPAQPTSQEKKASQDLALHLQEITQAAFPVVLETEEKLSSSTRIISVGRTELLDNTHLAAKTVDLGDEGYAIAADGDNLFLFGGKMRGPLFAVFAFLEEDLGVRWFTPDLTFVQAIPDLQFKPILRTFVPHFELRQPMIIETDNEIWALRNNVNVMAHFAAIRQEWGGSIPMGKNLYFVHTFNELMPKWKYFKDHPDYFSIRGGKRSSHQLCASHPDVARIIIAELLSRVKTGREIFSVSANDGGGYCQCPQCKGSDDAEGSGSAALLRMVNTVAAGVAEEYPDVRVIHLAYTQGTDIAPRTVAPHDNVIVQFCTPADAWMWPFVPYTQTRITKERLNGWIDKGSSVYIWDYVTNYSHALLPFPNMKVVAENIRFFADNKANGIFLEGNLNSGSDRGSLRAWVWAKLLWDPTLDSQQLIREFTYGYYGPAAEPMQQYNELLNQIYNENFPRFKAEYEMGKELLYHIRYDPSAVFLSKGPFLGQASRLFEQAESLAGKSEDADILRRVKLAKLPLLYTKLCRGPGLFYHKVYHFHESKEAYSAMIDEFESITRNENITIVSESRDGDTELKIERWRRLLAQVESDK